MSIQVENIKAILKLKHQLEQEGTEKANRKVFRHTNPPDLLDDFRLYHVNFDLTKIVDLEARLNVIDGICGARVSRYDMSVNIGRLFSWDLIDPQILYLLGNPTEMFDKEPANGNTSA